jgi:hypothetical protein
VKDGLEIRLHAMMCKGQIAGPMEACEALRHNWIASWQLRLSGTNTHTPVEPALFNPGVAPLYFFEVVANVRCEGRMREEPVEMTGRSRISLGEFVT